MNVAHGTWLPEEEGLFVWAETSSSASPSPDTGAGAGGRSSRDASAEPKGVARHPYQLGTTSIPKEILAPLSGSDVPSDSERTSHDVVLSIPTAGGAPMPSPELGVDEVAHAASLESWRVEGIVLSPAASLSWLVTLPVADEIDKERLHLGADLVYWSLAARFALELLARQRFLPGLVGHITRWEPLLEEETDRVEAFVAAMPPVCWAAENGPAAELLRDFVTTVVDRFVRQAASRLRLKPRFIETRGEELVSSLLSRDGIFEGDDVALLGEELASWRSQFQEEEDAPFRLAFRLDPPTAGDPAVKNVLELEQVEAERPEDATSVPEDREGSSPRHGAPGHSTEWTLEFFLQAVDDESLLVPVARVWEHGGASWRHLERLVSKPQEMVLEALGRAAALFPPLEESLREPRPELCRLSIDDAYRFLTEGAFLLRESGFGVLVPAWWGKRGHGVGLSLRVQPSSSGPRNVVSRLGLDALVEFDWQVALGNERLSREEFVELAALKQPLVRVRGQWVELAPERVSEVLAAMRSRPAVPEMTLGDVLALELGRTGDRRLPVTDLSATGFLEELLSHLSGKESVPTLEAPASFVGKLRPYQLEGLSWLVFLGRWSLGACLADDMGLGKTIQVLALLLHLRERGELDRPFLLICPTSVVGNWRKEAERFAPDLRVLIHHGITRYEGDTFRREARHHDLVVSTYSLVHRDLEGLAGVEWGGLVLDEAQNAKNPQAKQTRALRKLKAKKRIALTGTPVENRLSELWSIMEFLNPGYLGPEAQFRRQYALPIERYRDPAATSELRRLVEPFVLRRVKTDPNVIRDLPQKNEMKVYCTLTQEQATLYQAVVQESLERIERAGDGIGRKGEVLAALTRLKQICNHPAHFLADGSSLPKRSGKLMRLTEMLEEVLAENDRALVFTQYAEMGKLIKRHLRAALSVDVLFLHGAVPSAERERMIASFQEDSGAPPIFVLSLKAGGFGLNLTEARHVFHFDRWWNPAVEDQATDRAFRIGQTRSVSVYKFICAGTVEERVDALAERKKELAETVIQTGEGLLTELTTESLRELFELRREAIEG